MRQSLEGRPFHGEFTNSDASALTEANSRFTLYDCASTPTAITLGATERVLIPDVVINYSGSTTRTIQVYDGADATVDAGEKAWQGALAQNGDAQMTFLVPHHCKVGSYPKLKTSGAGQVDAVIHGVIINT